MIVTVARTGVRQAEATAPVVLEADEDVVPNSRTRPARWAGCTLATDSPVCARE